MAAAATVLECLVTVVLTSQNQPVMRAHTTEIFSTADTEAQAVITTQRHAFVEQIACGTYKIVVDGIDRRVFTLIHGTESTIAVSLD